ncbi:hypothetical protein J1N35_024353 [Gossypium stocksii]|uniref:Cathepsin propeptide inhibitor domain-containing protein n=1 Tax=Gossypium stocksii TaxID=47602 RepID=A0A9D3V4F6_9ROSI|nr:hypothetical protein J1N35_024353 [Gossypium stocksii]
MQFKIFKSNVEFKELFNAAGNRGYKLSINEFADQTNEFKAYRNGYRRPQRLKSRKQTSFRYVPAQTGGKEEPLRPSRTKHNVGCEDGEMEDEFEFRIRNHGIASEATYPYKGDDGTCKK